MPNAAVVIESRQNKSTATHVVKHGKTTYWVVDQGSHYPVLVTQLFVSKLGRYGERVLPNGPLRDKLIAAVEVHKATEKAN